jgi:integrase
MSNKRLGLRQVESLKPGEIIWDAAVTGFGARRQRSEAVSYFVAYRSHGRQRWFTIGRHGAPWTPDMARKEAIRILGEVVKGGDPAAAKEAQRNAATVTELLDAYLADMKAGRLLTKRGSTKKPTTIKSDRSRIERHIRPRLGSFKVAAVTSRDIEKFMHDVAAADAADGIARTSSASRTVGLLGAIFTYATRRGMRSDNPARGVTRYADRKRERRLSGAHPEDPVNEYAILGEALRKAEAARMWPPAVAAARFLALTGWRRGEALSLTWAAIDLARRTATLSAETSTDTKTGKSVRPLSHPACDVLRGISMAGALVFPSPQGEGPMRSTFERMWGQIGLPADVTPHVLRHSFASLAGDLGFSESTIAAMVGHARGTTTSRYIHAADAVLLRAADEVADKTAELMGERRVSGEVVTLRAATK